MSSMNNRLSVSVVAGGAGFISINLIPRLISEGNFVVVLDNLSRGKKKFLEDLPNFCHKNLYFNDVDCADEAKLQDAFIHAKSFGTVEEVWHFAANSDIPSGVLNPDIDLKDTFFSTYSLLKVMKLHQVDTLHFASSSAVYGDLGDQLLTENTGPLLPISNYGAMKLASEAVASAGAESFLKRLNIFRFPNVVGVPATHGVILDFIDKLRQTPDVLHVLGDGSQQKSYLHVSDLIDAMLIIRSRESNDGVKVSWIAEQVVSALNPRASIVYGKGNKGWVGDVPKFTYSTNLLQSFGWRPRLGSAEAVSLAIDQIKSQADLNKQAI